MSREQAWQVHQGVFLSGLSSSLPAWPPPTIRILHTGGGQATRHGSGEPCRKQIDARPCTAGLKLSDTEANIGSGKGCQAEKKHSDHVASHGGGNRAFQGGWVWLLGVRKPLLTWQACDVPGVPAPEAHGVPVLGRRLPAIRWSVCALRSCHLTRRLLIQGTARSLLRCLKPLQRGLLPQRVLSQADAVPSSWEETSS